MNAKKCKAIRRALREQKIDVNQVAYLARNEHVVVGYSLTELNDDGTKVVNCRTTAQTNYLNPACGRGIYRALKASMENV
jgi:hypothetical protein